ncbi:DUF2207 domain-containing protein, partial [Methanoculleus chikugoensis]|uniref:DUF2207 family protein n=1 Tax=Methanoculleus chikugoensis TaxID=118126 RepID=UPI001FB2E8CC
MFGFWKGDHYKEKLEWDAFSYFLSDLALIRQYSPADLSMWGEWLVYGTALGLGDKVEQAMKNLHIDLPDVGGAALLEHAGDICPPDRPLLPPAVERRRQRRVRWRRVVR